MTDPRIPTGPLEREPDPLFLPRADRLLALENALSNVIVGAWDRRIIEWLADVPDTSTSMTIVSLIVRARQAEAAALAGELAGLARRDVADPPLLTRPHDWPPER